VQSDLEAGDRLDAEPIGGEGYQQRRLQHLLGEDRSITRASVDRIVVVDQIEVTCAPALRTKSAIASGPKSRASGASRSRLAH
jgi:hypothetical protein